MSLEPLQASLGEQALGHPVFPQGLAFITAHLV